MKSAEPDENLRVLSRLRNRLVSKWRRKTSTCGAIRKSAANFETAEEEHLKLDAKFYGEIRKVKDDSLVPEDEWVCFLIKDNAFAATLPEYRRQCVIHGADVEQIKAVDRMIARGAQWRAENTDRLNVPDAKGEKLLG